MDTLPSELSYAIVESFDLKTAKKVYDTLSKESESSNDYVHALEERLDPAYYLRRLTCDPDNLLSLMEKYECALMGGCVLPYFFPDVPVLDSTWRIVCACKNIESFMKDSKSISMLWRSYHNGITKQYGKYQTWIGFSQNYCGDYVKIEIVEQCSSTPLSVIVSEVLSINQCFISWNIACHMHYSITESGTTRAWFNNISSLVVKSLVSDTLDRPMIRQGCKSCIGLIITADGDIDSHDAARMLDLRYATTVFKGTEHERLSYIRDLIQDVNTFRGLLRGYDELPVDSTIEKLTSTCICNYDFGLKLMQQYKDTGLHIKVGPLRSTGARYVIDNESYMYDFRDLDANTAERFLWPNWMEGPYEIAVKARSIYM